MDRENFTALINSFERKYPVNDWEYNGVKLWPLIKMRLSFGFHSLYTGSKKKENPFQRFKKSFLGFIELCKLLFPGKSNRVKHLYCLAPHFRFNSGNILRNRYFNDLIQEVENSGQDFRFLEYGNTSRDYRKRLDYPDKTFFLENLKYAALLSREILWKFKNRSIPEWSQYDKFLEEVNKNFANLKVDQENILKQFLYISILKNIYKLKLKHYNLNNVYILCYYVSEMYALNLACRELGISTWDIQHGGQGNQHLAYTNFKMIPKAGYEMLPKNFWCWDEDSAAAIKEWVVEQDFHQVLVKGNPWIEYCDKEYAAKIPEGKKIILYTMQPIGDILLDKYIIDAIKKTPSTYIWWLRLHPRQLNQKGKLKFLLEEKGLLNRVNIEEATNFPLPGILSKCDIHVSKFSGSILEAFLMKVKTIILSKIGVESFPGVIRSGYGIIQLEENGDKLINQILNTEKNH